jgi:hypothetical protein
MPEPIRNALPITGQGIPDCDFETPIRAEPEQWGHGYSTMFGQASRAAKTANNQAEEDLYESLRILCSFMPNFSSRSDPFVPEFRDGNRRSLIPSDLSDADLDVVESLLNKSVNPALRAHLGDIIWVRRKGARAVAVVSGVVDDYLTTANNLLTTSWNRAEQVINRALRLGLELGRQSEPFKKAVDTFNNALASPLAETAPYFIQHFLVIALQLNLETAAEFAELARKHADRADTEKDFERSRSYRSLEADFHQRDKNADGMMKARSLIAENYIKESEAWATKTPPSFIGAGEALAQGIELLRRLTGNTDRIRDLKAVLADYQRRSTGEMQSIPFKLDLREPVERAREHVRLDNFRVAVRRLAWGVDTIDPKKLREDVLRVANEAPLSFFSGTTIIDDAGRPQAESRSILSLPLEEQEKELELRMFRHATQIDWLWRAEAFIHPARLQIWMDHHPALQDLDYLVTDNPFVPPGHEEIFRRGLYYGFAGDMLLASHLLVPQLENSVRYVLESNGADIVNLESNLTQPVKIWGGLLALKEMETAFGPSIIFELRGLLQEKLGFNFRNNLCHGMVDEGDCYGHAAINTWWLTLRLCSYKIYMT